MNKLLFLILTISLILSGCVKTDSSSGVKKYVFEYKGVPVPVHGKLQPILDKIGKANDYFEAPSCAFQGMEKIYTYGSFQIHTYQVKGVDYVGSVSILDDSLATKEGVYLFTPIENALKVYGKGYTKRLESYTWKEKNSKFTILAEKGKVAAIEYTAILK